MGNIDEFNRRNGTHKAKETTLNVSSSTKNDAEIVY